MDLIGKYYNLHVKPENTWELYSNSVWTTFVLHDYKAVVHWPVDILVYVYTTKLSVWVLFLTVTFVLTAIPIQQFDIKTEQ